MAMSKDALLNAAEINAETATDNLLKSQVVDVRKAIVDSLRNAYISGYKAAVSDSENESIDNITI